jgi:O-antigen biosynthesis protein WbqP
MKTSKRIFDLVIVSAIAPFAVFACLLAALPILIESKASPFFWQRRLGYRQQPFILLKLRTMHPNTPVGGSHEIGQNSILKCGRILRKLKIDELPQIWNVVRGDMSLVGPRPGLEIQTELAKARHDRNVFELLPGITGVSQIKGLDMSTPELLAQIDSTYLGPWSAKRDLQILGQTLFGRGSGDAAAKGIAEDIRS